MVAHLLVLLAVLILAAVVVEQLVLQVEVLVVLE
jgi:hypothetical protein